MSTREGRAVAAGKTVEVNGRTYRIRPITIQHLCDLQNDALRYFKREYLRTYRENISLLGESDGMLEKKLDEVARWGLDDLPQKDVYDASSVPITPRVKRWLGEQFGEQVDDEERARRLLAASLDAGWITPDQIKDLCGKRPRRGRVRYDAWWITGCFEGMLSFIHSSIRYEHPEVTREEIAQWPPSALADVARQVESITVPAMGNG